MPGPAPTLRTITDVRLVEALRTLAAAGTLSDAQVAAVLAQLGVEATPAAAAGGGATTGTAPTGAAPTPHGRRLLLASRARLGEVAAYAGAVLVAAAGAVVVAQRWDALGRPGRAALLGGLTVLLAALGLFVPGLPGRRSERAAPPEPDARRRLASAALTAASATAAGTAAVLVGGSALLAAAVTAVVTICLVQWRAPSAVSEIAALGAVGLLAGAVLDRTGSSSAAAVATFTVLGAAWAMLAWTPVLTVPTLGLSLGLAMTLYAGTVGAFSGGQPTEGIGIGVLALLAAGGLAGYARTGRWPLAGAGAIAVAVLVLRLAGGRLGPAVALLLSGLVLLGAAALLIGSRHRRR